MNATNKVILNTAVTYLALIIKMAIGFFSIRLILQALGEESYGVYMVVAGVAGMLDILNSNMTNTSMRYLAHSLGSGNESLIKQTFSTTVVIHYIVGIATIILMEFGGWIMFEWFLNIPESNMFAAKVVFQFMILSTFISVIAVPYDAVMNAHEHIWLLSIFDIISAILNLAMAVYLLYCGYDRLIVYGLLVLLIQVVLRIAKVWFGKRLYSECRESSIKSFDKQLAKGILSFTGWNLFGSLAALGSTQFRALVLNAFFGVRLNAAEGISRQASGFVNMFAASMTRAINPQIMKSEGGGDRQRMIRVCEIGAKYSSFLFAFIGIPIIIEASYLLTLWLKNVPEYAVLFCQLIMIQMLIEKFTFQITHAIRAVGNIRNFQVAESIACLVYLPIAYFLFKAGYDASYIYWLAIVNSLIVAAVRFYYGHNIAEIDVWSFCKNAILPIIIPVIIAFVIGVTIKEIMPESLLRLVILSLTSCLSFTILFWIVGLNKDERNKWVGIIKKIKK